MWKYYLLNLILRVAVHSSYIICLKYAKAIMPLCICNLETSTSTVMDIPCSAQWIIYRKQKTVTCKIVCITMLRPYTSIIQEVCFTRSMRIVRTSKRQLCMNFYGNNCTFSVIFKADRRNSPSNGTWNTLFHNFNFWWEIRVL